MNKYMYAMGVSLKQKFRNKIMRRMKGCGAMKKLDTDEIPSGMGAVKHMKHKLVFRK
jgi:hypothetical protein